MKPPRAERKSAPLIAVATLVLLVGSAALAGSISYTYDTAGRLIGADDDGDGVTNLDECRGDTDPNDGASFVFIAEVTNALPFQFEFDSSPIRLYDVEYANDLENPTAWSNLQTGLEGDGKTMRVTDTNDLTDIERRHYRIEAIAP